jgi:chromosome segregation ATPase
LKEDLKAALRKALSTADELSRVKKSMVENEGTSSRAEARVEALESMLRAKEEELAGAKTAESLAAARAEKLEADAASSDDARARESAELEKSLMDLRVALDAANSKAESALGECERLKNELEAESSRGKLDELRGELDAAREKANEMTKKYEETKVAASDELRRARETESALSAALSDAEAQLVDSRKNVDLIVSRADKASEIFRENATALRLADARAATAELEASVAEERVKALEESLREVEEERDACKEELETLQKQPKQVSPTSPIASPAKTSAPIDVVEALEHERRARALYQSDARYWRERYESIASGAGSALTPIPSFASTPSARTPGSALAIAAGLPKTPTTAEIRAPLRVELSDVDQSTENEPIPTVKEDASPSTDRTDSVDRGVENTPPHDRARVREKLAAYFR